MNERTNERVAQYLRLDSWLFCPTLPWWRRRRRRPKWRRRRRRRRRRKKRKERKSEKEKVEEYEAVAGGRSAYRLSCVDGRRWGGWDGRTDGGGKVGWWRNCGKMVGQWYGWTIVLDPTFVWSVDGLS